MYGFKVLIGNVMLAHCREGNALDSPKLNLNPIINASTFYAALSDLVTLISEVLLNLRTKWNKIHEMAFKERIKLFY